MIPFVSGGQAGVDRVALDAAIECGILAKRASVRKTMGWKVVEHMRVKKK